MRLARILAAGLVFAATAAIADAPVVPHVVVTGEGRVEAAPDMATISLGVTSEAKTAGDAASETSTLTAEVLATLKAAGIAAADIQTSGLSLEPRWDYGSNNSEPGRITGFVASNGVTVRVRALDSLGDVLDRTIRSGANTFGGLAFGLSDPKPVLDEARRRAVADARARAMLLAEAAGVPLGRVLAITDLGGTPEPQPMQQARSFAEKAVPIAEGTVSTAASVTIDFAIGD